MNEKSQNFSIVIPAQIQKSGKEWVIRGLASTASKDQQGEIILQNGIDTQNISAGKAYFNWDHKAGPENILGPIDKYQHTSNGLVVEGRLFKHHARAKAVHEIMASLGKSDKGKIGMSVEGCVLERAGDDGKTIKRCKIRAVAITMNPVNQDSHASLLKSLTSASEFEIETVTEEKVFTTNQVTALIKALSAGEGYLKVPTDRSGGEALEQEDLDTKIKPQTHKPSKKKSKLKKMNKDLYKSNIKKILENLQVLYPEASRSEIWESVKDRLNTRFPNSEDSVDSCYN